MWKARGSPSIKEYPQKKEDETSKKITKLNLKTFSSLMRVERLSVDLINEGEDSPATRVHVLT